jgi:hypothetical protein
MRHPKTSILACTALGLLILGPAGTAALAQKGPLPGGLMPPPADVLASEMPAWPDPSALVAPTHAHRPAPPNRLWAVGEYLYWWTRGMNLPPLATTSLTGTPSSQAGVLGNPATMVLFGDQTFHDDGQSGGRWTIGTWLDPAHCRGLEVGYLFLGEQSASFRASAGDFSILARPFFNVQNDAGDARRIVFPDEITGQMAIDATTQFQAAHASYRVAVPRGSPCRRVAYLFGYRFVELEDQLQVSENTQVLGGPLAGTRFALVDDFDTRNTFHGGEIGVVVAHDRAAGWSWETAVRVALGTSKSRVTVDGRTVTTTSTGDTATTPAGLLAQSTNIGTLEQSDFAAIPQLDLKLRRHWACGITASVGYTFLYWGDIARVGDQVDLGINTSQIPPGTLNGPARPALALRETDFAAQGLSFGIEYVY